MMNDFLTNMGLLMWNIKVKWYTEVARLVDIPRFLKWSYYNGGIHIEDGLIQCGYQVYMERKSIKGYYGCVYKSAFKKILKN